MRIPLIFLIVPVFSEIISAKIYGNIEHFGYYYLEIWVGTPSVRQTVILDTGSSLTAFPCTGCLSCGEHIDSYFDFTKSSTFKPVLCTSNIKCSACNNNQCEYHQSYAEGSSISGILVQDNISITLSEYPVASTFGCHLRETNLFKSQKVDGIMGLSYKNNEIGSIIDDLFDSRRLGSNSFSLCLGQIEGILTIGGFNQSLHLEPIQWIKLYNHEFYSVQASTFKIESKDVLIEPGDFSKMYKTGTIFDSGTTFVYLTENIYLKVVQGFKEFCKVDGNCRVQTVRVFGEPQRCYIYDLKKGFSEFLQGFPEIIVVFDDFVEYRWKPEEYLFAWPESPNYYCVGIYNNFEGGNVLGGIFMRGKDVVFNRSDDSIGFAFSECGDFGINNRSRSILPYVSVDNDAKNFSVGLVILFSCGFMGLVSCIYMLNRKKQQEDPQDSKIIKDI